MPLMGSPGGCEPHREAPPCRGPSARTARDQASAEPMQGCDAFPVLSRSGYADSFRSSWTVWIFLLLVSSLLVFFLLDLPPLISFLSFLSFLRLSFGRQAGL